MRISLSSSRAIRPLILEPDPRRHTKNTIVTTNPAAEDENWPHPITASDRIYDRKSVFLAHASHLPSKTHLAPFLNHLTSLPELKRATHCMYAYRTTEASSGHQSGATTRIIIGQNDGGESGAGNQLSRLLEVTGCENVVIVVSRWYGGVQLGSDRWKRIAHVAKEALSRGNFLKEGAKASRDQSEKKQRK
ncbi:hypothetical protein Moror_1498 [Moniliophthora roreri MCA 2997]|uniref:Impact N-terminal domain-containing protein n=1 Tax=Moniliophthora roreri (strain MCA 2997) TaxID=1381753 RepID=V2XLH4_MONRO|nr:hypothetical protein Moror_1498 [Moniliophthora roreri MCA 2997]